MRLQDRAEPAITQPTQDELSLVGASVDGHDIRTDGDDVDVVVHRADGELRDLRRPNSLLPANLAHALARGAAGYREPLREPGGGVAEQVGRAIDELFHRPATVLVDRAGYVVLLDETDLTAGDHEALSRDVLRLLGAEVDHPWGHIVRVPRVEALALGDVAEGP